MKKITNISLLILILSICISCEMIDGDDSQKKDTKLGDIGFKGSLLNGVNFSNLDIIADNELSASSYISDGSYVGHTLSLIDNNSGFRIMLSLPTIKFSDDFIKIDQSIVTNSVKTYYPVSLVEEKLAVGDKSILSSDTESLTEAFQILVIDNKNSSSYITNLGFDQTGSYLKVIDLQEGIDNDSDLGTVKTFTATFEIKVKLYKNEFGYEYAGDITGLLKMRFKDKT